ncbi:MAG: hypothetical protein GAK30_00163 [Paracidovorax wautersii]|uniref:Uncharacterized protein n=1 Tax=Paracidovorax wautersii TaxID=1177982 RepID=A0A7V8JRS4_9BURK|nr:MAG: hypothetical protein GAK30_00163 [Paracidovorax wautersii]
MRDPRQPLQAGQASVVALPVPPVAVPAANAGTGAPWATDSKPDRRPWLWGALALGLLLLGGMDWSLLRGTAKVRQDDAPAPGEPRDP